MVAVRETRAQAGFEKTVVAAREYLDWTRGSRVLQRRDDRRLPRAGARGGRSAGGTARRHARVGRVLSALRRAADGGRAFTRDAEQPGSGDVILISHRVWQERFAGAADVVGRTVRVEGRPTTIIGILPAGFSFIGPADLVVPITFAPGR